MVDKYGGFSAIPAEYDHDNLAPTDDDKNLSAKKKKKNKKKAAAAAAAAAVAAKARANSISSHTTAEPNGDGLNYAAPPDSTLASPAKSVVEERPFEEVHMETEANQETAIDPDGDLLLYLVCENVPATKVSPGDVSGGTEARQTCRVRVSSRHLRLASLVLKEKLSAAVVGQSGPRILSLPEGDKAMVKLLNIIHHRDLNIPRAVTLDELCELAQLVETYQMAESVGFVVRTWVEKLLQEREAQDCGNKLPVEFGEELLRWLFVSWAFCLPREFETLSKVAITQSPKQIDSVDIPGLPKLGFPKHVVDAIDKERQSAVRSLLSAYQESITRLIGDDSSGNDSDTTSTPVRNAASPSTDTGTEGTMCPHGDPSCDASLVGALIYFGKRAHLFRSPKAPYHGLSFEGTQKVLEDIQFPSCPCEDKIINTTISNTDTSLAPSATSGDLSHFGETSRTSTNGLSSLPKPSPSSWLKSSALPQVNGTNGATPTPAPTPALAPAPKCVPGSAFKKAIADVARATKIQGLDIRTLLAPDRKELYDMPGNHQL